MFCECVGWHSYEKNHNSIMFVWGLFCILRIALKPDRKYAVRLISKTAISSSGRADDNQDCCMVRGSRPRWRSNFSKLFWIRSPYFHPCKVEHCHCLAIQDGSDQWKSPHRGEWLKWEAKDSSKLIGNKDHALRGLSSPMVGIRQIRLITYRVNYLLTAASPLRKSGVARIHQ